jgi:hypothetical protein
MLNLVCLLSLFCAVAQLAMLHYWVTGLGVKLPGLAAAGDGIPDSMPAGFDAITSGTWPVQGWAQVLLFCSALEVLAPQKDDKAPGDVQPDTPAFPKLEDKSPEEALDLQNKEVRAWVAGWVDRCDRVLWCACAVGSRG